MPTLVPVDGPLLRQILDTAPPAHGLARDAWAQYERALTMLPWGLAHRRWVALVDDGPSGEQALDVGLRRAGVLASAHRYDLAGTLDGVRQRICGIGGLVEHAASGGAHGRALVGRLVDEAASAGYDLALLSMEATSTHAVPDGFALLPTMDLTLRVTESPRRGAPMAPVRGGDAGDMAMVAEMAEQGARPARFRLERTADEVAFAFTRQRLLAGLGRDGARQLQFLVAEEGMRAVAYVVLSVAAGTWTLEECGDRDPSGARVGAILQALIARDPAETRPVIRGWLPTACVPPQVTVLTSAPSADRLLVRALHGTAALPTLLAPDVHCWRTALL